MNHENIKQQTKQAIYRAMNLQEFEVLVNEYDMILNGTVRYDIHHRPGSPYRITVPAMSQAEAETRVAEWIREMKDAV